MEDQEALKKRAREAIANMKARMKELATVPGNDAEVREILTELRDLTRSLATEVKR